MINDLHKALNTARYLMFADDLKLYHSVNSVTDHRTLERDVDAISIWCEHNGLALNIAKCKVLSAKLNCKLSKGCQYSIGNAVPKRIQSIHDLGVIVDPKLDFHDHVTTFCKAANKTLDFIMRASSQFPDTRTVFMLYNAFIRSRL